MMRETDLEPRAFDVIEAALGLLRAMGPGAYGTYAAGTLAFLWFFLWFWAYMSRNAMAFGHAGEFSLMLALAFIAMKTCHAFFFRRLMTALGGDPPSSHAFASAAKTLAAQALLQPLALAAMPLAILFTIPLPWVWAFFQNAQWVRDEDGMDEWLGRSIRLARLWPKQNLYICLFLVGAWFCLCLNVASGLAVIPHLLKTLFGFDSVFTRSPSALFNTTFAMLVPAVAWALLDPLVKAVHAWRCFHGLAIRDGMDLRLALARIDSDQTGESFSTTSARPTASFGSAGTLAALLSAALLCATPAHAAPAKPAAGKSSTIKNGPRDGAQAPDPALSISPGKLDGLIKEEMADARYGWRFPRELDREESPSWSYTQLRKLAHAVKQALRAVRKWWLRFEEWFNGLFRIKGPNAKSDSRPPSTLPVRILLYGLLAAFAIGILAYLLRKKRPAPAPIAASLAPAPAVPDAADETQMADAFPEDEWLRLMETLLAEGKPRLALRALFMATLSLLARKGWIAVARHKSNRDYAREVALKSRRKPQIAECFGENCRRFDRVWYGAHEASEEDWTVSRANFARVKSDE